MKELPRYRGMGPIRSQSRDSVKHRKWGKEALELLNTLQGPRLQASEVVGMTLSNVKDYVNTQRSREPKNPPPLPR